MVGAIADVMVDATVGSDAGISVLLVVAVFVAAGAGVTVGICPQADSTSDKNTSTYKSFFINWILHKNINFIIPRLFRLGGHAR